MGKVVASPRAQGAGESLRACLPRSLLPAGSGHCCCDRAEKPSFQPAGSVASAAAMPVTGVGSKRLRPSCLWRTSSWSLYLCADRCSFSGGGEVLPGCCQYCGG
jgi:hypothetical protein